MNTILTNLMTKQIVRSLFTVLIGVLLSTLNSSWARSTSVDKNENIDDYGDKLCWYGNTHQSPNFVGIYEMAEQTASAPSVVVYDFENGMNGWTSIDADNDGKGWVLGSMIGGVYLSNNLSAGQAHNASADMVCSGSYSNITYAALTPDNYLVSPQITLGGSISFWACAQDNMYAAEHFGVAVSTTNGMNASAFTTVQEWTMTAKSVGAATNYTRGGNRYQGQWYQYTVDLSSFSGQGYVAIRHFNCTNMFILNIDDISISNSVGPGISYTIAVSSSNGGSAYIGNNMGTIQATFNNGDPCTVRAVACTGYGFVNWKENGQVVPNAGAEYTFNVSGNRNLMAQFNPNTYIVVFHKNATDATGTMSNQEFTYGTSQALTSNGFSRPGYTFAGWATTSGGSVLYGDGQMVSNLTSTANGTVNLYAKWTANGPGPSYTIAVSSSNGGSAYIGNNMGTIQATFNNGDPCTVRAVASTGYGFVNWKENGQVVPNAGAEYTFNVSCDRNLMAQFDPNTYTVVFNKNAADATGTMSNQEFTYGTSQALTSNGFSRPGYTFAGWATTSGGSVTYTNGQMVSNLTSTANGTVNLYAKWTANTYTVVFNKNATDATGAMSNQEFTYGTSQALTSNGFLRTGYTFAGWAETSGGSVLYGDGQMVSNLTSTANGTVNLYAKWTANGPGPSYTIAVSSSNGGSAYIGNNTGTIQATFNNGDPCTVRAIASTGYSFVNWKENGQVVPNAGAEYTFNVSGDRNLMAQFDPNTYTVVFNKNAADATGTMNNQEFTYGTSQALTSNGFSRPGYTFAGWAETSGGPVFYGDGQMVSNLTPTANGTVNLYAKWNPNPYTVTLDNQGATFAGTTSVSVTYNAAMPTITVPTKTGYTFGGYFTSTGGNGTKYYNANGTSATNWNLTSDATLYAKWNPNPYTVTLDNQGATFAGTTSVSVTYNAAMPTIIVPTKTGYTFGGYFTSTGGDGTKYYNANGTSARNWNLTSNTTLYAKWTANTYTVTLHKNDGTINSGNVTSYTYGVGATLPTDVTRTGYTFGGWYNNSNLAGSAVTSISTTATGDKEFWAKWTANTNLISATAGANGSIFPQGDIEVLSGEDKAFTITPNFGCRISKVIVDGVDLGPLETYTFSNVNKDHTILALFSGWGVEESQDAGVRVFPNPTKGIITVEGQDIAGVQIYNLLGEKMLDIEGNDEAVNVNLEHLPSGAYIVLITMQNGKQCYMKVVLSN